MVDNGVKVLNNFWGGVGFDFLIKVVMDYVLEWNVIVVVFVGNELCEYY